MAERPLIVLDTNVLISGLYSPSGAPRRVVDLIAGGFVRLAYDERILDEYRRVAARPRFALDPREVDALLLAMTAGGLPIVPPVVDVELPDPTDLPFVEVAIAAHADALVTGNARHYRPVRGRIPVALCSPREFLNGLETPQR